MNDMNIHTKINNKLEEFIKSNNIPNIIFHGPSGSGKRTILNNFLNKIYIGESDIYNKLIFYIDCGEGKGIKFIREDLKFFAKCNSNLSKLFKSIVLLNADKLTIDAQSAIRRVIELFNFNTRFFIVVEDKYKLLKPILSRFCEIYIPLPLINKIETNLYKHNLKLTYSNDNYFEKRNKILASKLKKIDKLTDLEKIIESCDKLYEQGFSSIDIINYLKKTTNDSKSICYLIYYLNNIRLEYRNEPLIILNIILYIFFRSDLNLENISI
jgi:DNA polymerase III delta prime subunit